MRSFSLELPQFSYEIGSRGSMTADLSDDGPGTPFIICHNEVDTHYYNPDTIQKETRAMLLSFEFTSAQTIAEEQDRKQRFPVGT